MSAAFFSRSVMAAAIPSFILLLCIMITFSNGDGDASMHHHPGHDEASVGAGAARNQYRAAQGPPSALEPPIPSLLEVETGKEICYKYGLDYSGNDIKAFNVYTPEECQYHCQKSKQCKFFTYDNSKKTCHTKTSNSGQRQTSQNYISGPKYCKDYHPTSQPKGAVIPTSKTGCFELNVNRPGYDIDMKFAKDVVECKKRCQGNKKCKFFTFIAGEGMCFIKSEGAKTKSIEGDHVSGSIANC